MNGHELNQKYGIQKNGATLRKWIRHGVPIISKSTLLKNMVFDPIAVDKWVLENKAKKKYLQNDKKKCTRCREIMAISEFPKDANNASGLCGKCHKCSRASALEYAAKNREKIKNYSKQWRVENKADYDARMKKHKSSKEGRARSILTSSVHRGRVVKPDKCQKCGSEIEKSKLHGHHHDYDKPLDVLWVCSLCHGKLHSIEAH